MALDIFGRLRNAMNRLFTGRSAAQNAYKIDTAVTDEMERKILRWWQMYTNHPEWVSGEVYSLGLPKAITREFASTVTSEMCIDCTGSQRADYLADQISANLHKLQDKLQDGMALGGMALKPYVYGSAARYIGLDVVSAAAFTPARFDDGGICVSGVFKSAPVRSGSAWYVKLEYHDYSDGTYTIKNKAFHSSENGEVGREVSLSSVPVWADIQTDVVIMDVQRPLFGYFSCQSASESVASGNVGCSVYSGATEDLLREADYQWSRFLWEFSSAERKIIGTPESISGLMPGGKKNPLEHDRLFVQMNYDSEEFFKEFSPELRNSGFYDGLQAILRRIEFNVGLAYGDLSDPSTVEKTAAEIKHGKSRKYNTVNSIEKRLQTAIENAVYGMDVYTTLYSLAPRGDYDLKITWDDSILEDSETERNRDLQEVSAGLMAAYEYRMKWYGEDEDTAKAAIREINSTGESGLELMFNA